MDLESYTYSSRKKEIDTSNLNERLQSEYIVGPRRRKGGRKGGVERESSGNRNKKRN